MDISGSSGGDGEKQPPKIASSSTDSPDDGGISSSESASIESRKSCSMDEKPRKDRSKLRKGKWTVRFFPSWL
jgi:hypothetical protein